MATHHGSELIAHLEKFKIKFFEPVGFLSFSEGNWGKNNYLWRNCEHIQLKISLKTLKIPKFILKNIKVKGCGRAWDGSF